MSGEPLAIAYARVSTAKQAVEGESLELQADLICQDVAAKGWRLVPDGRVFQEPFTGTTNDRPVYREALAFIKAHRGQIKFFVVRSIDRFTREGSLQYQQMKAELASLGVELRDIGHVIQPTINTLEHLGVSYSWSRTAPSTISEVVLAEAGRHEVSVNLTRMIGAEIKLVREGYHIGPARDGYLTKRIYVEGKKKCVQVPDPDRAHFYARMFAMRAEGTHSDEQIVAAINAVGFRTRPRNRWNGNRSKVIGRRIGIPLSTKQLQAIIRNPVYCGVICCRWTDHQPVLARGGEPVVSIELYNRANRGSRFLDERPDGSLTILYDHQPTPLKSRRHKFRKDFPFKNVVGCPHCGKPLVASASRGRNGQHFGAYHCARGHARYSVAQATLEKTCRDFLHDLRVRSASWPRLEKVLRAAFQSGQVESLTAAERTQSTIKALEGRKDQLVDAFAAASSPSLRADLERRINIADEELEQARATTSHCVVSESDFAAFLSHAREIVEHPAEILTNVGNIKEQLALYGLVFERRPTYPEFLSRTAQLSPLFELLPVSDERHSSSVHPSYLDWNQLQCEVLRWSSAGWAIASALARRRAVSGSPNDIPNVPKSAVLE